MLTLYIIGTVVVCGIFIRWAYKNYKYGNYN